MTGKDRERRLARERYARNLARRAVNRERARKRNAVIGAVLGVVVVLGGTSALAATLGFPGGDGDTAQAGGSPSASAGGGSSCSYDRVASGQRTKQDEFIGLPSTPPKPDKKYKATLDTNRGTIVINLLNDAAPCTVNSFRFLASEDFYSKTTCHRLVTTGIHVLQCGDPSGSGRGGPGYTFGDENLQDASYTRGTVAMANSGPDTNGSQFFIVYEKGGLSPKYTPFGKVTKGLTIVDKIAQAGVAEDGTAPKKKVVIQDVTISERSGE